MAERMTRQENWGYLERTLRTGEVAEQGHVCAFDLNDAGLLVAMKVDTGLLAIGYFAESMTGDGTKKCRVRLFKELILQRFNNAVSNPVTDADVGKMAYFTDTQTVSISGTGRSVAGRVWKVSAAGVLIEPTINVSPDITL